MSNEIHHNMSSEVFSWIILVISPGIFQVILLGNSLKNFSITVAVIFSRFPSEILPRLLSKIPPRNSAEISQIIFCRIPSDISRRNDSGTLPGNYSRISPSIPSETPPRTLPRIFFMNSCTDSNGNFTEDSFRILLFLQYFLQWLIQLLLQVILNLPFTSR